MPERPGRRNVRQVIEFANILLCDDWMCGTQSRFIKCEHGGPLFRFDERVTKVVSRRAHAKSRERNRTWDSGMEDGLACGSPGAAAMLSPGDDFERRYLIDDAATQLTFGFHIANMPLGLDS